jgi:hypothetical protein
MIMAYSKCFSTSVIRVVLVFVLCACSLSAQSALIDRGEGFIYDDVLDVTWAQNANIRDGEGIDGSGQDIWDNQVAWAAGYSQTHTVYGTFDDWRLPTVTDTNWPGCNFTYTGTDCGYNVDTSTGEMASLFYDTLGNLAYYDTSGSGPQSGWGLTNTGPFTNLQSHVYWSGTEYNVGIDSAWHFRFDGGDQDLSTKNYYYFALAVRDGDVAAVPVPAALWLFGSALGLLGWMRRRVS